MVEDLIWAWTWLTWTSCHLAYECVVEAPWNDAAGKSRATYTFEGAGVADHHRHVDQVHTIEKDLVLVNTGKSFPSNSAISNSVQHSVHSCATRTRSFASQRPTTLQSWLSRSPSASWRPIKLIFNAPMSTHSSPPRPPYSHFARQHQARRQHHATRNRNLLLYSTAAVRILGSLSILTIHLKTIYRLSWG